jgi:hypothetical protein
MRKVNIPYVEAEKNKTTKNGNMPPTVKVVSDTKAA